MKRLLLIFIVLEHVISFIHALPYQEVNIEEFEKSKKNYSIIILLEDNLDNSIEDVPKKTGRTIHQTAWSKENKNDEGTIVVKDTAKTNTIKNKNSWDLSHLLKLILNLVYNKEENTDEVVNNGKDNSDSKNKPISGAQKPENSIGKKLNESPKNDEVELISNFESNSYNNYPFDKSYEQKKQNSGTATGSSNSRDTEKTAKSKDIDTDSSLKLDNKDFIDSERLIDELTLQESKRSQLFDNNYYDDDDYQDDKYCDSYSTSFSSEKAAISKLASKEITEDSYEVGGIEVSDEDDLKHASETAEELLSEIPSTKASNSSINQNESNILKNFNQNEKEPYDEICDLTTKDDQNALQEPDFQNNVTSSYRPLMKNSTFKEVTDQSLTSHKTQVQSTTPLTPDAVDYEISELQEVTDQFLTSPQTQVQATTPLTPDAVNYESSELQEVTDQSFTSHQTHLHSTTPKIPGNVNYESSGLQEVTGQSLTSHQTLVQSTAPFLPDVVYYPTKNAKFQPQMHDQLSQETILQEKLLHTESTQSDSSSEQTSFSEVFLKPKTPDTIQNRQPVKKAKNDSINNQETNQEFFLPLPLSSSGEFISYISEKDQQLSITSKKREQLSKASEKDRQLSKTSKENRHLSNTSENDQQLSNTSESKPVNMDSQFHAKKYSKDNQEANQKLLFPLISSGEFISYLAEKDRQLSISSEKRQQLPNTSGSDRQVSNISESDQNLSNTSENGKQIILLEANSKRNNLELSELQKDLTENGQEKTYPESSSLSHIPTSLNKEQEEIQSPFLQNMIIIENEKKHFSGKDGANDLTSEGTSQIINNFAYQQDGFQKDNTDFNKNQVAIMIRNEADDNLNNYQNGDSLQINQISKRFPGISVNHDGASKNIKESKRDNEYYEFDAGTSVNYVSENNQKLLESVKTSPTVNESDQNDIILPNEPEKPYDTILQFLYKHSNSSLIKSLKENY